MRVGGKRKFGDKLFYFYDTDDSKRNAERRADWARGRGYKVRVTEAKDMHGNDIYVLWTSPRKRKPY